MLIVTEGYETIKSHDLTAFVKCRWGWIKYANIQQSGRGLKNQADADKVGGWVQGLVILRERNN